MVTRQEQHSEDESGVVEGVTSSRPSVVLPDASYIAFATFEQVGFDLVVTNADGEVFVVHDYFALYPSPDLVLPNGMGLTPEVVAFLLKGKAGAETMFAGEVSGDVALVEMGRVTLKLGKVTVERNDGTTEELSRGDIVYVGDRIQTGNRSFVKITMQDGARFNLGKNADATLTEYEFNSVTESGRFSVFQSIGPSHYRSGRIGKSAGLKNQDGFQLSTPTAVVRIRGSSSDQDQSAEGFRINLTDGVATVNNYAGTAPPVVLSPGESSVVSSSDGQVGFSSTFIPIVGLAPPDSSAEVNEVYEQITPNSPPPASANMTLPGEVDAQAGDEEAVESEVMEGEVAEEAEPEEEVEDEIEEETEADVEEETEDQAEEAEEDVERRAEEESDAEVEVEAGAETEAEAEQEAEVEQEAEGERATDPEREAERQERESERETAREEREAEREDTESERESEVTEAETEEEQEAEGEPEADPGPESNPEREARVEAEGAPRTEVEREQSADPEPETAGQEETPSESTEEKATEGERLTEREVAEREQRQVREDQEDAGEPESEPTSEEGAIAEGGPEAQTPEPEGPVAQTKDAGSTAGDETPAVEPEAVILAGSEQSNLDTAGSEAQRTDATGTDEGEPADSGTGAEVDETNVATGTAAPETVSGTAGVNDAGIASESGTDNNPNPQADTGSTLGESPSAGSFNAADNTVPDAEAESVIVEVAVAEVEPAQSLSNDTRAAFTQSELLNSNRSPVPSQISDLIAVEGIQFGFSLSARNFSDPDGDFLQFRASGLPAGLSFDAATETILGTPTADAIGEHVITIEARDPFNAVASTTFNLTVLDRDDASSGNIPPILSRPIFNQEAIPGEEFSFQIPATTFVDLNGDSIRYSVSGLPGGLFFDSADNTIKGSVDEVDIGLHTIRLNAFDSKGASGFDEFVLDVFQPATEENTAPALSTPVFDQAGLEGEFFEFIIPADTFEDADDDPLDFTVAGLPTGLAYDDATRTISGTPTEEDVGSHTIQITAADGKGGQVVDEFLIDITSAMTDTENAAPSLVVPILDQSAFENVEVSIPLEEHFQAPDGDELSFAVSGLPTGIFFDEFTNTIIGTPTEKDLGSYRVQVRAFDGQGGRIVEEFFLDVIAEDAGEDNRDPVLAKPLFNTVIGEGEEVVFPLEGTFEDPDGDELDYEVTGLPTSLFVDPATNTVIGTPTDLDVGSYLIQVTAFDGRGGKSTNEFVLDVLASDVIDDESNTAPNLVRPLLDRVISEGDSVFVNLDSIFEDADGDVLTYAIEGLPPSFFFDSATGGITGQPTAIDVGSHSVTVTAFDGRGGQISDEFILDVVAINENDDNTPPNLVSPLINQEVFEGDVFNLDIAGAFEDKDGDPLQFVLEGLPTSLFLDPATNTIVGTPTAADVGTFTVKVTATDGRGGRISEQFFLDVLSADVVDSGDDNTPPRLISPFLDQTVDVGTSIFTDLNNRFEDPDGDFLDFTVSGLPPSLFFDSATDSIVGTPEQIDVGSYLIEVSASDGRGGKISSDFFLTVVETETNTDNRDPVLRSPIFDAQLVQGELVSIPLEGTFIDEDGDALEYVVSGLPPSLFVDPATNSIVGTLADVDVGSYTVEVRVFDGKGGRNFDEFFLDIRADDVAGESNTPPQLVAPFRGQTIEVGNSVSANIGDRFSDPDGDVLVITVGGLPPSLFFDPATNTILGTPEEIDVGSYLIEVGVSDGRGGTNSAEFLLSVVAADDANVENSPPTLSSPLFNAQLVAGQQVSIPLEGTFTDPDGDPLEYVVSGLPPSLFVDAATNSIVGTLTDTDIGSFSISVNVFDGNGGSNFDEFFLDVVSAGADETNTRPQLVTPFTDETVEVGEAVFGDIGTQFSDPDGDGWCSMLVGYRRVYSLILRPTPFSVRRKKQTLDLT